MTQQDKTSSRRGMLFGTATVGAAAAAVLALPKFTQQEAAAELPKVAPEKGGGYHLTDRVKQYYSSTLI